MENIRCVQENMIHVRLANQQQAHTYIVTYTHMHIHSLGSVFDAPRSMSENWNMCLELQCSDVLVLFVQQINHTLGCGVR